MPVISRGFGGRNRSRRPDLPPGQYLVTDFPVLSAGPTPRISLDRWEFQVITETGGKHTLLEPVVTTAGFALVGSYGGYTTNLPLADLMGGRAWIAYQYDGEALDPEHGGPARLLVPHLYLWKSAKWVNKIQLLDHDEPGFWESAGYHNYGDPWREQRYWGD